MFEKIHTRPALHVWIFLYMEGAFHVRKNQNMTCLACSDFFVPLPPAPLNYCSAGGMRGRKEQVRATPAAARAVADIHIYKKNYLVS